MGTNKEALIIQLATLTSYTNTVGLWADEEFNYGFGSLQFENGGYPEGWVYLGNCMELIDLRDKWYPQSDLDWDEDVAQDMAFEWAENYLAEQCAR